MLHIYTLYTLIYLLNTFTFREHILETYYCANMKASAKFTKVLDFSVDCISTLTMQLEIKVVEILIFKINANMSAFKL